MGNDLNLTGLISEYCGLNKHICKIWVNQDLTYRGGGDKTFLDLICHCNAFVSSRRNTLGDEKITTAIKETLFEGSIGLYSRRVETSAEGAINRPAMDEVQEPLGESPTVHLVGSLQ